MRKLSPITVMRKKRMFENFKARRVERVKTAVPRPKYSMSEVVKMAADAGMSYGHFVDMMHRNGEEM